tara:strand:- start:522 stop:2132 length:1611 start_codon:yes stop_codon:yes gene_type:complete
MKKLELRHIIRRIIQEEDKKEKTNQKTPSNNKKIAVEPDKGPPGPGPNTGCEGIPQECPEGQTFSFEICRCVGLIDKEPLKGPKILGCMDPDAFNYNENANTDDGSCYYNPGCTDSNALNYDETADFDNDSCEYPEGYFGCTDPDAANFSPEAEEDDGSCITSCCEELEQITAEYDAQKVYYDQIYSYVNAMDRSGIVDIQPIADLPDVIQLEEYIDEEFYFGTQTYMSDPFDFGGNPTSNTGLDVPSWDEFFADYEDAAGLFGPSPQGSDTTQDISIYVPVSNIPPSEEAQTTPLGPGQFIFYGPGGSTIFMTAPKWRAYNSQITFKDGTVATYQGSASPENLGGYFGPIPDLSNTWYTSPDGTGDPNNLEPIVSPDNVWQDIAQIPPPQLMADVSDQPTLHMSLAPQAGGLYLPNNGDWAFSPTCQNLFYFCASIYNQALEEMISMQMAPSWTDIENQYDITYEMYQEYVMFNADAQGYGPNASGCCPNNETARLEPESIQSAPLPTFSAGEGFQDLGIDMSSIDDATVDPPPF